MTRISARSTAAEGEPGPAAEPSEPTGGDTKDSKDSTAAAGTRTLVVNPYLRIVQCNKDEFLIRHGTRSAYSEVLHDDGHTGLLGRVLGNLTSPGSVQQLVDQGLVTEDEKATAGQLAEGLVEKGILTDPAATLAQTYLTTLFNGASTETPLTDTTLGIVGCGQLGTKVAEELGRLGLAGIVLFDPRPSSATDVTYLGASVDGTRDAGLRAHLGTPPRGQDAVEVVTAERAELADDDALDAVCARSSFVVLAMETYSPTVLHALNERALARGTPWISAFFDGSEAVIGPTYVPGETCCYHEFETQSQASLRYKAEYLVFKEYLRDLAADTEPLVLPPYASVVAGFVSTSVLHSLLHGSTFTSGRAVRINFETLSIDLQDVLKLPRCPACGGARPTYRNLFL